MRVTLRGWYVVLLSGLLYTVVLGGRVDRNNGVVYNVFMVLSCL
jgi:hypothetical protein